MKTTVLVQLVTVTFSFPGWWIYFAARIDPLVGTECAIFIAGLGLTPKAPGSPGASDC